MDDTDNTRDRGLTADQIAAAGSSKRQGDVPALAGHEGFGGHVSGRDAPQRLSPRGQWPSADTSAFEILVGSGLAH